jgi:hypothetical protein
MTDRTPTTEARQYIRTDAITGTLLHRAWLKSGRPDPLLDTDAWDGFGLTIAALAEAEGIAGEITDAVAIAVDEARAALVAALEELWQDMVDDGAVPGEFLHRLYALSREDRP